MAYLGKYLLFVVRGASLAQSGGYSCQSVRFVPGLSSRASARKEGRETVGRRSGRRGTVLSRSVGVRLFNSRVWRGFVRGKDGTIGFTKRTKS